jgi:hypothetical protein
MGFSRFSGPVYGAKAVLAAYSAGAVTSSGASTALAASWIVPPGEDWFVCDLHAYGSTMSSLGNTVTIKSEGGSTINAARDWGGGSNSTKAQTIGSVSWGTSTGGPVLAQFAATAGEMEGVWVPSGSTVRAVLSSVVNPIANFNVSIYGYRRFVSSTRAE